MTRQIRNLSYIAIVSALALLFGGATNAFARTWARKSPAGSPAISLSSTSLNFGNVKVGSTSSVQYVTVTNTGDASLNFSNEFSFTGDFASANIGTCGMSVAAGTSCTASVSFTPTASGTRTGTLTMSDNAANSTQTVSLTGTGGSTSAPTVSPLQLTSSTLANGTAGSGYSTTLTATGGTSPYTWSLTAGALPAGLTLSTNGTISGTPSAAGTSSFSVTAKDSESTPQTATVSLALTITAAAAKVTAPALQLTTSTLASGTQGSGYSANLTATGGTSPYTWSLTSGALPTGLTLSTNGTISGTPSAAGTSSFSVTAKDSESTPQTATASLALTIAAAAAKVTAPALQLTTSTLASGTQGSGYSTQLSATGGTSPYTWSLVSGALPAGLTLSTNGTISGTPSAAGTSSFSATVTDSESSPQAATASLELTITAAAASSGPALYVATTGSDSNAGTSASPFATIAHAISVAKAGTTVNVAPGTYKGDLLTSTSGTASNLITYTCSTPLQCFIVGDGSAGIVWTVNANYNVFQGFDITSASDQNGFFVGWSGSNFGYDQFIGNYIHDFGTSGCNGTGGAAIELGEGATSPAGHNTVLRNRINNIAVAEIGQSGCDTVQGIMSGGPGDVIDSNLVGNVAYVGITMDDGGTNETIVNNTVFHSGYGISYGNTQGSVNSVNNYIANNILYGNTLGGILEFDDVGTSGNTCTDNLFYSNAANYSTSNCTVTGTLTSNPMFVNYQANGTGNYQLSAGSPALKAGTATNAPPTDLAGTAQTTPPSIGAY